MVKLYKGFLDTEFGTTVAVVHQLKSGYIFVTWIRPVIGVEHSVTREQQCVTVGTGAVPCQLALQCLLIRL